MKTSKKDFELFKKECRKWIDKLELNTYSVYFQQVPLDHEYAKTMTQYLSMQATMALASDWDTEVRPLNRYEIAKVAKHEAVHLLLSKMDTLATSRFVTKDELDQAEHEIVRKLENIL